jgi:Rieske Fe-S protein
METPSEISGRRRFLGGVITTIQAAIGGTLAFLLGGAIVAPGLARRQDNWVPAGSIDELPQNQPKPVMLRVARQDGYTQVVDRQTVFLVRTGEREVTALDSTCTHLGCRVSWDSETQELKCPCHGGIYEATGAVKAGPPPAPLARLETRIDGNQVLVQV